MSIENITTLHLDLNNASQDADRPPIIAEILFALKDILVTTSGNETFYNISYDQIAKVIFEKECRIDEESLLNLKTLVKYELGKLFVYAGWNEEEERALRFKKDHLYECYSKLVTHIHLSYIQKNYIEKSARDAFLIANQASDISIDLLGKMTELSNEIQVSSANANTAVNEAVEASDIAKKALDDVEEAIEQSKSAIIEVEGARADIGAILDSVNDAKTNADKALKQANIAKSEAESTSKNITTQFVTILGIFASIIVALFGGMSLIRATVELLQSNGNLLVLVFVTSILLLSFSLLIILLTSWISSLKSEQESKHYYVLRWMTLFILTIVAIVCGILIHDNPIDESETKKPNFELEIKTKGSS